MKKSIIIWIISCSLFQLKNNAQDSSRVDTTQKQATIGKSQHVCFAIVETHPGVETRGAVERFTPDSVFIIEVDDKYIKAGSEYIKVLMDNAEKGFAISEIGSFTIEYDPNIVYPEDIKQRKRRLRGKNAGRIMGWFVSGVVLFPLEILTDAGRIIDEPLMIDPKKIPRMGKRRTEVSGMAIHVSKRSRFYAINGDKENYLLMMQELTRTKKNPFENVSDQTKNVVQTTKIEQQ